MGETVRNYPFHSILICLCGVLLLSVPGRAETVITSNPNGDPAHGQASMSLDEIARELSNPVGIMRSIGNEFEYRSFQGDLPLSSEQSSWVYRFEPSIPFELNNGKRFIVRASIPISDGEPEWDIDFGHPLWDPERRYTEFLLRQSPEVTDDSGDFLIGHGHLSDISYDLAYGGVSENGWISMYGMAGVFGSSTNKSGARHQTLLGPEFAIGKIQPWGVIGAWFKHLVDVGGEDTFSTSETSIDVFFAHGLGNGWQVISNPAIIYDWEADSGNGLLLPLGGGVAKTTRIGKIPLKMELEIYHYIVSPDRFGPQWLMSFNITPVLGWK